MSTPPRGKSRLTVPQFVSRKAEGKKLTVLTAYDYPMASLVDQGGVDAILVGDTLSMVVQGHDSTIPVTLDEMIYHAEMVTRAVSNALVIVDMPFPSNLLGVYEGIRNAGRILKETGAQAVKLEGGADQAEVISGLVNAGIPVMAHIGLRPQLVHQMGGYRVQRNRDQLIQDAKAATEAGAFSIVLECIPQDDAAEITKMLDIPTIGIGAGNACDGQVLVLNDMLGITEGHVPKFVKQYANIRKTVTDAVRQFCDDVQSGEFPDQTHSFR
ncbi:3-methyl-2-oxobutanoate hydroxymethyltransferase [Blastopirellula marina]|uniref:3-methyl-2-oxobutanoate hydroxymethyltransferase n=1 Tax=Blastopirellula marina TaxID=124 RepID=A0A2S8FU57_9BACT|nr:MULTISPECIES: 3-methyl-2-oxobutanoate hydroxymethyltransferase [Pirellulaceae]PQO35712.1 3-methyl-2-oxobutanoate hydroxymethyltransferase [Blastopirellula marina]RCS53286.1 3-methyl-2-oxobutanoate hydroxymethyltransferase [Bremerella cremea]